MNGSIKYLVKRKKIQVSFFKTKYHERLAVKLNYPKTAPKTYWSPLKTFANGSKIP